MNTYLIALILITVLMIGWGMTLPDRVYQFPFLAGVVFAGVILPQAIGLTNYVLIPEDAVNRTLLMTSLCAAMIIVGYEWPKRPLLHADWKFDTTRLIRASAVLTLIGAIFWFLIWQLPAEMKGVGWSGLPVAYIFFARMFRYGFAISLLVYALTGSRKALAVAGCGSLLFIYRIVSAVKRGPTAEFFIILVLAAWFGRGKTIPRSVIVPGLVIGMLLSTFNIGEIRRPIMNGEFRLSDIQQIEWNQDLKNVLSGDSEFIVQAGGGELEAAAYYMDATQESGAYNWGTDYWNALVINTVPGQLFGEPFVRSLLIDPGGGWRPEVDPYAQYLYTKRSGLTTTGMTDSFGSFWYFGCIKFFIIAFIMSKLFLAANRGNSVAQILCMVLTVPAMHAITHSTFWFYKFWPHMLLFLLPALLYARVGRKGKNLM